MADDTSIPSGNLNDVLTLLGGGGSAAALKKGVLVSPAVLRALGGAKSMHPAVAKTLGMSGPLTDQAAVNMQRDLDSKVMNYYDYFKKRPSSEWPDIHNKYGWQFGPAMGLSREIPDTGMAINTNPRLIGPRSANVYHPAGDITKALNVKNVQWDRTPDIADYDDQTRNIRLNPNLNFSYDAYHRKYPGRFDELRPWDNTVPAVAAHELQHASQNSAGKLASYDFMVPYPFRRHEVESEGVEYRMLHPDAYQYPFHMTAQPPLNGDESYSNFMNLLANLKRNGQ